MNVHSKVGSGFQQLPLDGQEVACFDELGMEIGIFSAESGRINGNEYKVPIRFFDYWIDVDELNEHCLSLATGKSSNDNGSSLTNLSVIDVLS
ncbi:MAG: hypothetical protein HRT61_09875 [Ekhidna sp.]|nr:hypothetical protein [Ekhidna sp.]